MKIQSKFLSCRSMSVGTFSSNSYAGKFFLVTLDMHTIRKEKLESNRRKSEKEAKNGREEENSLKGWKTLFRSFPKASVCSTMKCHESEIVQ